MLRLAARPQFRALKSCSVARAYTQATSRPSKTSEKQKSLEVDSDEHSLKLPAEGSMAASLLKETASGKAAKTSLESRISEATAKRRAARLAREAAQGKAAPTPNPNYTPLSDIERPTFSASLGRPQRRSGQLSTTSIDFEQLSTPGQGPRRNRPFGNRESSSQRSPRQQNGSKTQPKRRVLTQNKRPAAKVATEEVTSLEDERDLVCAVELPTSSGPLPVMREFTSLLPKAKNGRPRSQAAPAPSRDSYTTPVNKLPILTQLSVASATTPLDKNARKILESTVASAVGTLATA